MQSPSFQYLNLFIVLLFLNFIDNVDAQKIVYIPSFISDSGMDLNNDSSQWSYKRSLETENIVIFWEPGFGDNPNEASLPFNINMENLVKTAEKTFPFYLDSLRFVIKGSSVTDRYKLMIFLLHTTDWAAYGSGHDDLVGSLFISPAAANLSHVVAHEIGHSFQYITGCDTEGGFRYGYGENGAGGNGFWEQCAQWKAYKVFPELQFSDGDFNQYIRNNHLHILHEKTRYANYFLPDYWTFKRGIDFMGKLWRDSRYPEDPVEAYKRLNNISQNQFNLEIFEHAARLTTWDLPSLLTYGNSYINIRPQVKMFLTDEEYWQIDSTVCIENYGYNSLKLDVPIESTTIEVHFKGLAGVNGYRNINTEHAGWHFGFGALLKNGDRIYSEIATAEYNDGVNPEVKLNFICPNDCDKLWLVVSGAPKKHWRHPWDDNELNDEQWPYKVKFVNTNLLGKRNGPLSNKNFIYDIEMEPRSHYTPDIIELNREEIAYAFVLSEEDIIQYLGNQIKYYAINPDGTLDSNSTAFYPGHWFDNTGTVVQWGNNSYIYSEININDFNVRIGQYPDVCKNGDKFTISQAFVYKRTQTDTSQVTITFNISIKDTPSSVQDLAASPKINIFPNPTSEYVYFLEPSLFTLFDSKRNQLKNGFDDNVNLSEYKAGVYVLKLKESLHKIVKL